MRGPAHAQIISNPDAVRRSGQGIHKPVNELSNMMSFFELACLRYRWEALDGCNIAAHAFASCCIIGRVWALNGSQEV
jgi:hypothetical protein